MTTGNLSITGNTLPEFQLPEGTYSGIKQILICKGCGALTITLQGDCAGGVYDVHVSRELADKIFLTKGLYFEVAYYSCNYCINHWGVDLCKCGSGEKFWECEEGYPDCGKPHDTIPGLDPKIVMRLLRKIINTEISYANVIEGVTCSD